jgi:hypothetical protein
LVEFVVAGVAIPSRNVEVFGDSSVETPGMPGAVELARVAVATFGLSSVRMLYP